MSVNNDSPTDHGELDKSPQLIDGLKDVPLNLLGEVLASTGDAQELIEDVERFKNLPELLKDFAEDLRTKLGIGYCIINEHNWSTGGATTLADSCASGFQSRAEYKHSLATFAPLLKLGGTPEGVELMSKLNLSPAPNQICIEDFEIFDEYPLLKEFKAGWPWQSDRAMAFSPLVFGEQQFPGAIACINSEPRSWSQDDCRLMLNVAKQASRAISKERELNRLVNELHLKVKEYFRLHMPEAQELTDGELRVLVILQRSGLENREISEEIGSTERAVKKHILNMLSKTGCKNRTQLALWGNERLKASG